jgi:hypothetical protein
MTCFSNFRPSSYQLGLMHVTKCLDMLALRRPSCGELVSACRQAPTANCLTQHHLLKSSLSYLFRLPEPSWRCKELYNKKRICICIVRNIIKNGYLTFWHNTYVGQYTTGTYKMPHETHCNMTYVKGIDVAVCHFIFKF